MIFTSYSLPDYRPGRLLEGVVIVMVSRFAGGQITLREAHGYVFVLKTKHEYHRGFFKARMQAGSLS